MFPEVNGYTYGSTNPDINVHSTNKHTEGWRLDDTTRLIWTNGYVLPSAPPFLTPIPVP
jgi:hypothetical protein